MYYNNNGPNFNLLTLLEQSTTIFIFICICGVLKSLFTFLFSSSHSLSPHSVSLSLSLSLSEMMSKYLKTKNRLFKARHKRAFRRFEAYRRDSDISGKKSFVLFPCNPTNAARILPFLLRIMDHFASNGLR